MTFYREVEAEIYLDIQDIFYEMSNSDKEEMADLLADEFKITRKQFEHTDEQFIKDFVYYLKYQDLKGLLQVLKEELK